MLNLAADTAGTQPLTYVLDDQFNLFTLDPAPQDDATLNPYSYTSSSPVDGIVTVVGATHFVVSAPSSASIGGPVAFTVTAQDQFNATDTGYTGTIHFTSSDANALLPADATLTNGVGVFTATLQTPGTQTITATDTAVSTTTGTSNGITVRGFSVASVLPEPTGFVAQFSSAFAPTSLGLYTTAPDVTLTGPLPSTASVHGSIIIDPSDTSFTFVKTGTGTAGLLTPGTYTLTLASGATGITDTTGGLLYGNGTTAGTNFVTSISISPPTGLILSIPDFARGPDGADDIKVPNNTSPGIPLTITNPTANPISLTDLTFTLSYLPSLLTISGTLNGPAGSTLTLSSNTGGLATFVFQAGSALTLNASATLTLGQLVAQVPNSAAALYKSKALLHVSNITASDGAAGVDVIGNDGVQVVAYLGDVNGDGVYSPIDAALIARVAVNLDPGFAAFPMLDPAIVGDVSGVGFVTSTDVTIINRLVAGIAAAQIPLQPNGLVITPTGPDPILSLPTDLRADAGGHGRRSGGHRHGPPSRQHRHDGSDPRFELRPRCLRRVGGGRPARHNSQRRQRLAADNGGQRPDR